MTNEIDNVVLEKAAATRRLLGAIPYFRVAIADAAKKGKVELGILATLPDGSGNIEVRFAAEEFFNDLALLVDAPPQTEEDNTNVLAVKFLQTHNLRGCLSEYHTTVMA